MARPGQISDAGAIYLWGARRTDKGETYPVCDDDIGETRRETSNEVGEESDQDYVFIESAGRLLGLGREIYV